MSSEKVLSPREFVRLNAAEKRNVKRTEFVPPRLGEPGFGKMRVVLRRSTCGAPNDDAAEACTRHR